MIHHSVLVYGEVLHHSLSWAFVEHYVQREPSYHADVIRAGRSVVGTEATTVAGSAAGSSVDVGLHFTYSRFCVGLGVDTRTVTPTAGTYTSLFGFQSPLQSLT